MRRRKPGRPAGLVPLGPILLGLILVGHALTLGCRHASRARPTADAAEARFLSALAGDVDDLAPLLAEDFVYLTSEGSILDRQALLDHLRSGATRIDRIAAEELRRSVRDGLVVTTGHLVVDARREGEAIRVRSRYVHVWIETAEGWQLLLRESDGTSPPPD